MSSTYSYFEISAEQKNEALAKGYKQRYFFPHQTYFIPKCYPEGFQKAEQFLGRVDLNSCWEIILYAISPAIDEFPREVFFDNDIMYHQQQFGKTGQVAAATLYIDNDRLYSINQQSELVQRISRRRDLKTRVEKVFNGWNLMLWNSILIFALSRGLKYVYSSTAELAMANTDRAKIVQPELFDRLYNRDVHRLFHPVRQGDWWRIDVGDYQHRVISPRPKTENVVSKKTICICHDIERELGHIDVDPSFAENVQKTAPQSLYHMLRVEKELGIRASYNVVGSFLDEVKDHITSGGHGLAFHSYDHQVEDSPSNFIHKILNRYRERKRPPQQLNMCRKVDQRLKGYRTPRSHITSELREKNLCRHNFEWIASSTSSLGTKIPLMKNRIVHIPIHFDDFPLYKLNMSYEVWEREALKRIESNDFIAIGLHDCYGEFWLPHYQNFLKKIKGLGRLKTFNEVAEEVTIASSTF